LEAIGHRFRSQTDTDVIALAYEQWGKDCARQFNGMWAYVIWDVRHRRLVCSRDRFGIKPLMIARVGDAIYFASEAKARAGGKRTCRRPFLMCSAASLGRPNLLYAIPSFRPPRCASSTLPLHVPGQPRSSIPRGFLAAHERGAASSGRPFRPAPRVSC
jgi:asparagine synthetase B (glutamine-hydrolysing)